MITNKDSEYRLELRIFTHILTKLSYGIRLTAFTNAVFLFIFAQL